MAAVEVLRASSLPAWRDATAEPKWVPLACHYPRAGSGRHDLSRACPRVSPRDKVHAALPLLELDWVPASAQLQAAAWMVGRVSEHKATDPVERRPTQVGSLG